MLGWNKFTSIRGRPTFVYSDQGTQLSAGAKSITAAWTIILTCAKKASNTRFKPGWLPGAHKYHSQNMLKDQPEGGVFITKLNFK